MDGLLDKFVKMWKKMRKILIVLMLVFIMLLSSCVGIEGEKINKILEKNNYLYNEKYGIELKRSSISMRDYFGYLTKDNTKIEIYIQFWVIGGLGISVYDLKKIPTIKVVESEGYPYPEDIVPKEEYDESYLFNGDMNLINNRIVIKNFIKQGDTILEIPDEESEFYKGVKEIPLYAKKI